jgi:hypothetical protein
MALNSHSETNTSQKKGIPAFVAMTRKSFDVFIKKSNENALLLAGVYSSEEQLRSRYTPYFLPLMEALKQATTDTAGLSDEDILKLVDECIKRYTSLTGTRHKTVERLSRWKWVQELRNNPDFEDTTSDICALWYAMKPKVAEELHKAEVKRQKELATDKLHKEQEIRNIQATAEKKRNANKAKAIEHAGGEANFAKKVAKDHTTKQQKLQQKALECDATRMQRFIHYWDTTARAAVQKELKDCTDVQFNGTRRGFTKKQTVFCTPKDAIYFAQQLKLEKYAHCREGLAVTVTLKVDPKDPPRKCVITNEGVCDVDLPDSLIPDGTEIEVGNIHSVNTVPFFVTPEVKTCTRQIPSLNKEWQGFEVHVKEEIPKFRLHLCYPVKGFSKMAITTKDGVSLIFCTSGDAILSDRFNVQETLKKYFPTRADELDDKLKAKKQKEQAEAKAKEAQGRAQHEAKEAQDRAQHEAKKAPPVGPKSLIERIKAVEIATIGEVSGICVLKSRVSNMELEIHGETFEGGSVAERIANLEANLA